MRGVQAVNSAARKPPMVNAYVNHTVIETDDYLGAKLALRIANNSDLRTVNGQKAVVAQAK